MTENVTYTSLMWTGMRNNKSWKHHDIETLSALVACEGNPRLIKKNQSCEVLLYLFGVSFNKLKINSGVTDDLRCHDAHVTAL